MNKEPVVVGLARATAEIRPKMNAENVVGTVSLILVSSFVFCRKNYGSRHPSYMEALGYKYHCEKWRLTINKSDRSW